MNDWKFTPDEDGHLRIYWMKMILYPEKSDRSPTKIHVTHEEELQEAIEEVVRLLYDD
jgi:hypothetical protein